MMKSTVFTRARVATSAAALGLLMATGVAGAGESVNLLFSGIPAANGTPPPTSQIFKDWCGEVCFPTTRFPVHDPMTGQFRGHAAVWGRSFQFGAGGSLCFSEYIAFTLLDGEVHIRSGPAGTCGAPMDPALKPPRHADLGATVVIAGGGDGQIVAGTGRYETWTGTFSDRVFVGFGPPSAGVGGIVYYDQLWFILTRR